MTIDQQTTQQHGTHGVIVFAGIGMLISFVAGVVLSFVDGIGSNAWLVTFLLLLIVGLWVYRAHRKERAAAHYVQRRDADSRAEVANAQAAAAKAQAVQIATDAKVRLLNAQTANAQAVALLNAPKPTDAATAPVANRVSPSAWTLTVIDANDDVRGVLSGKLVELTGHALRDGVADLRQSVRDAGVSFSNADWVMLSALLGEFGIARKGRLIDGDKLSRTLEAWRNTRVARLPSRVLDVSARAEVSL